MQQEYYVYNMRHLYTVMCICCLRYHSQLRSALKLNTKWKSLGFQTAQQPQQYIIPFRRHSHLILRIYVSYNHPVDTYNFVSEQFLHTATNSTVTVTVITLTKTCLFYCCVKGISINIPSIIKVPFTTQMHVN